MVSFKLGRCLLQDLLDRRKITQQQLADRVGMTKQQINNYCSGYYNMSLLNALIIANELRCSVDDLYELIPVSRLE